MTSPAERYAESKRRAARAAEYPALEDFMLDVGFDLDDFQRAACESLERGSGVLVCAPTGAGKTVVGEFAVHLALRGGERKCFYTTPIKALSNQKYHDLVERYGGDKVGLLTGDNSINGDAPVVVMTTEVLRNMLYAGSASLKGLAYVVMDEVHYLADRFRGAVWEEVIIHLPASVTLVSLSATVSNYEEFADWLVTVRGETQVVVSEHRPVPLWQHMLVGRRMFDLFHDADAARKHDVHPELLRYTREMLRRLELTDRAAGPAWNGRGGRTRRWQPPPRPEVVDRLERAGLLPAILFIFSRAGCDAAVQQCLAAGLRLTDAEERAEIRTIAEAKVASIPREDLSVLGYWEWLDGLERGVAAHHAGMLPAFKEAVEECFVRGLVKAVFATETLALGINMPARCVVLERLVKFNGEAHVDLTPGEYTQLTGRAGRRGIDVEGHAVVLWSPEVDPRHVAGLASTRTYPLRSSFRPSYNMAVNLVATVGADKSRDLLESSFAQFQADRSVVGLARQVQRNLDTMRTYCEDPGAAGPPGRPRRRPGGAHRRLRRAAPPGAHPGSLGRPSEPHRLPRRGRGARTHPGAQALQPPVAGRPARPGRSGQRHRTRPARRRPARPQPVGPRRRRRDRPAEGATAPAPVPRLSRPRGARPLGRAPPPPAARHRGAAGQGGRAHRVAGTHLRPGLRGARRPRLPHRRR
jgi:ATP-dependent RNA helicase HelY